MGRGRDYLLSFVGKSQLNSLFVLTRLYVYICICHPIIYIKRLQPSAILKKNSIFGRITEKDTFIYNFKKTRLL